MRECDCETHMKPALCDVEGGEWHKNEVSAYNVVCPSCLKSTLTSESEDEVLDEWEKGNVR